MLPILRRVPDRTVYIVRHASAVARDAWPGSDALRPLSPRGWQQAVALAEWLVDPAPAHFLSSPTVRCRDTLVPVAHRVGGAVVDEPLLADLADSAVTADVLQVRMRRLLRVLAQVGAGPVAACSHGDTIPVLLRATGATGELPCPKGGVWELRLDAQGGVRSHRFLGRAGEG